MNAESREPAERIFDNLRIWKIIENKQKERMESRIRLEQVKKQPPSFSQTEGKEVKLAVGVSL